MAEIILQEGTAPATPAANTVTMYAKADGLLYNKDDAGNEYQLSNTAGSNVTLAQVLTIAAYRA